MRRVDPRAKVIYLLFVAVAAFVLEPAYVGGLAVLQLLLCWPSGVGLGRLLRALRKLSVFLAFLVLAFVFLPGQKGLGGDIKVIPLGPWSLDAHMDGLWTSLLLAQRILTVVLASLVARSGSDPAAFARALFQLGMPRLVAISVDASLDLFEEGGGGKGGRGRGKGGGRGRGSDRHGQEEGQPLEGGWAGRKRWVRALVRGDDSLLARPMAGYLKRATERIQERHPGLPEKLARDAVVVSAVTLAMLSLKMIKTLPGMPVAPGHKNALLIPLYLLASDLTRSRLGATATGTTMGILSFLLGDGRYGVFEIAKHIAPGALADLLYPPLRALMRPGVLVLMLLGVLLAAGRFATEMGVALLLGVPASFYAYLGTAAITHLAAGAISAFPSRVLLQSAQRLRDEGLVDGVGDAHPQEKRETEA